MLYDGSVRKGVLSPHHFQKLIKLGLIAFPEVTEEEIEDRSKGDGLSKSLVLVQVAWFIAQFSARIAKGLAITPLELVAFAFATLNGFMYFFWWNKPLNIHLPIAVQLLCLKMPVNEGIASRGSGQILFLRIKWETFTFISSAVGGPSNTLMESRLPEPNHNRQAGKWEINPNSHL